MRVEKRRNPTKVQKRKGIKDGWYVDADQFGPEDKWIFLAVEETDVSAWPAGEHPCEALGPKIQGNPLGLERHVCVPFNLEIPTYEEIPRSYSNLQKILAELESHYSPQNLAEGIVFHHPDGRRAHCLRDETPYGVWAGRGVPLPSRLTSGAKRRLVQPIVLPLLAILPVPWLSMEMRYGND